LAELGRRQAQQTAIQAERERLATELHDDLAQTLGFLHLKANHAKGVFTGDDAVAAEGELNSMQSTLAVAYGQVRAALVNLRDPSRRAEQPVESSGQAISQGLEECIADFRATAGLTRLWWPINPLDLPPLAQAQVVHIVREALTNARRHASADHVWVRADRVNGEARFVVEDDGWGFDPTSPRSDAHLGLEIMRARAERSGGRLAVESACGVGTKVSASYPLARPTPDATNRSRSDTRPRLATTATCSARLAA
jgi:two-component system nitrate/nitrite sensor histidine kinase NarX